MPTAILGLSAYYHDSAAALLVDGRVIAAAQEERFSRKKHDASFPAGAVACVLGEAGMDAGDLDTVAFYDKPLLKFERILETALAFAPRGLKQFRAAMPVWMEGKLMTRRRLREELTAFGDFRGDLRFPEHHLSHAASAFFPSPFVDAAVLTMDGVGEWATTSLCHGQGNRLVPLKELRFPHSPGLLYSAFTEYCGFRVNGGEYKLMGLAPHGNPRSGRPGVLVERILKEIIDLRRDGSFLLNMEYFDFACGLRMCREEAWEGLFGIPRRRPDEPIDAGHADLALAAQRVLEEIVLLLAKTAREETGSADLALAGGVALNCVANGRLLRESGFRGIWVQPAAGDAGGALGAALAAWHIGKDAPRPAPVEGDRMEGALLGPEYDRRDILRVARRHGAAFRSYTDEDALCRDVAGFLAEGKIVGWFQGRMEFGPRALGNRSILADPRRPEMQARMNAAVKRREGFRPFAPAVLAEYISSWFELDRPSPYMLFTVPVRVDRMRPLPEGFPEMTIEERLLHPRSDLPAVTHVDGSARTQTVQRETNGRFHRLLSAFRDRTGCPVLLNTSFNVRGEPIVCTPADAYRCFVDTEIDHLVLGDFLFSKGGGAAGGSEEKGEGEHDLA